jgi:micrococcal nuclease
MVRSILYLILIFVCSFAHANGTLTGTVTGVIDGNTLEVTTEQQEVRQIILSGIDSPELSQEFGDEAKKYLEKLALKRDVTIEITGKDRKGNTLAVVLLKGKRDLRIELLREGLAWTAEKDPLPQLEVHRTFAQEQGKGLWKTSNPTPPWTFRRQQSMLQPKSSS